MASRPLQSKLQGNVFAAGSHVSDPKRQPRGRQRQEEARRVHRDEQRTLGGGARPPQGRWAATEMGARSPPSRELPASGERCPESAAPGGRAARTPGQGPLLLTLAALTPKQSRTAQPPLSEIRAPGSRPPGSETWPLVPGPAPTLPPRDPPRERLAVSGAPLAHWLPMPTRTPQLGAWRERAKPRQGGLCGQLPQRNTGNRLERRNLGGRVRAGPGMGAAAFANASA